MADRKYEKALNDIAGRLYDEYCRLAFVRANGRMPTATEEKAARAARRSRFSFGAVIKRLVDYYSDCKDLSQVELVALTSLRHGDDDFDAVQHLGPLSMGLFRRALEVPDGAWDFALWIDGQPRGPVRVSAEYWMGKWMDAGDTYDDAEIALARKMLGKLMSNDNNEEAVEEIEF